jgi:thiamine phosphate synthase YjbQ (UPF0047 family)
MRTETRTYDTSAARVLDITRDVARFVSERSDEGLVSVFVPHATAGVALM